MNKTLKLSSGVSFDFLEMVKDSEFHIEAGSDSARTTLVLRCAEARQLRAFLDFWLPIAEWRDSIYDTLPGVALGPTCGCGASIGLEVGPQWHEPKVGYHGSIGGE